jgi:hypothetical protein
MQLAEILARRPVPCAGLLLTLTERCPMRCAHCSSASTTVGQEPDAGSLARFTASFEPDNRPDIVMLTGGEPLLLPALVNELAETARRAGARTAVLTGAFFARNGSRIPARIVRAFRAVDHVSVSLDAFHEREVARGDVFRVLRRVLDMGLPASVHTVGAGPDDPYLADLIGDVRRVFADQVPLLVNTIRPVGRAAAWATARPVRADGQRLLPCAMAAWPVVARDGTVVACCNQTTATRRPVPEHLRLGHVDTDDWASIRDRALSSPVLRMIRTTGPADLLARYGTAADSVDHGYCEGCQRLGEHPEVVGAAEAIGGGVVGEMLDRYAAQVQVAAGPVTLVRRHGIARYADLIALPGTRPSRGAAARPLARQPVSAVLRTKFAQATPALRTAAAALWQEPGLDRRYPEYLRTMHGVIRASVPLMELASRRCAELAVDDPVAGPLLDYLREHVTEERGHDDWLLADLAALGCDPTAPLAAPPALAVARLVGPQYYWIEHYHPVTLLGYIAVMEDNAPAPPLADRIARAAGVPPAAVRTVRAHAELDSGHSRAVFDLLDLLRLTPDQVSAIAVSGLHTADALLRLFDHVITAAGAEAAHNPAGPPDRTQLMEAHQTCRSTATHWPSSRRMESRSPG